MSRRWVHAGSFDGYVDSQHVYPPVGAIELHRRYRYGAVLAARTPATLDMICTRVARERPLRCRPWKIAR